MSYEWLDIVLMESNVFWCMNTCNLAVWRNIYSVLSYLHRYELELLGLLMSFIFLCVTDLPAGQSPLDWTTRMKIALGIAEGLEYLHEKADPKIIYRDLKSSKVLLNDAKIPKLSDCGLANLVQSGNRMHASVMAGYNGYCAPEYERNGDLTIKSDVYSFGVVLLELITGRRALDTSRPVDDQSLVSWVSRMDQSSSHIK